MNDSEIARLRQQIAAEYMAAKWGLEGLCYGTAKHPFISKRMEHMEDQRQQLNTLVGEQAATSLFIESLDNLPQYPTRHYLHTIIQHELGDTEKTAILLDHIMEAWETLDMLIDQFGTENAIKIIMASPDSTNVVPS